MGAAGDRNRADAQLDAALLEAVLRAATDYSIIATDLDGIVTVFNPGAERMLGYQASEVVGQRTPEVFHDRRDVERRAAELGIEPGFDVFITAARAGRSETREWTYVRKDGSRLPVALSVSAVVRDGRPIGYLGIARDLTREKQAQRALEESSHWFETVFDASPIPIVITRARDGVILKANAAALAVLGWTADEFVGRPASEVRLWPRPQQWQQLGDRLAGDGRVRDVEEDVLTKDGSIRRVLASIELVELDGETCLVTMFLDVTDRSHLESALRESETALRAFLDHAPAMVSLKDPDLRFRIVNRQMSEVLGVDPRQVIGRTARDVYPEAVAEALEAGDREVLARGETTTLHVDVPTASGECRVFLVLKFPVSAGSGTPQGVGTIATDVTEARQAQQALAASEERFRQLAESVEIGFVLRSVEPFEILYASPQMEAITGVPTEEVRRDPRALLARIHPDDRARIAARLSSPSTATEPQELEYRMLGADGTVRWLRARARPAYDPSGRVTRVASTVEDITSWKLVNLELETARAEAERANRAKSEFLSRMSHELRTPLHAILGFSELLELEPLTPEQRDSVGHVRRAGRHLLALIDEVLDVSRIESGQLALSLEPVHLSELVREVVDIVRPLAAVRRLTLAVELDDDEAYVLADRQRLKQVLLNLLSNAVKYNRDDGRIRVASTSPDPDRMRIIVSDTGIGIPDASLDRLFTPFERLGAEQSEVEGTGLGLALSRRLVEAMQGTIGVESRVGEGTTFWIDLDRSDPPDAQDREPRAVSRSQPVVAAMAGTVLYVEDNLPNLKLVERILARRPGVTLLSAIQGTLGLELAVTHRPDLILLDLNLPDMPGLEVLRRLRARPETSRTPIVVASADATRRQVERVLSHGANDYLTKPIEVERLLGWVDRVLGDPHDPTAVGRPESAGESTPAEPAVTVLDCSQLDALRDLDDTGDAMRRIAELFLRDAPSRVQELIHAAAAGDPAAARAAAHSLTGSARTVGATRLATVTESIDQAARDGELPGEAALTALKGAIDEVRAALTAEVAGPPSA